MNERVKKGCTVRISLKERCVYISKSVLRLLGDPQYIQFLINRKTRAMFIWGHDVKVEHSIAVNPRIYSDARFQCKIKKSAFVEAIGAFCEWDNWGKYQLCGIPYSDRIIRFSFTDAKRLDRD
jgi:hypothetical protein